MAELTREYYYAINDPSLKGLFTSLNSLARVTDLTWARGDQHYIGLRPCRILPLGSQPPLEQVAQSTIASVRVAVGDPDKAPTAGGFTLGIANNGTADSDVTAAISYSATGSDIETAINAVCSGISLPNVTATKTGVDYLIYTTSADFIPTLELNNLTPECEVSIKKVRDASSGVSAVWRIRVSQKGIAYATPSTSYAVLSSPVTATSTQTGSGTQEAIQSISLSPVPIDGKCKWTFNQRQKVTLQCVADVAGSLSNKIAVTLADSGGDVQIYLTNGSGTPPEPPASGRQISVSYLGEPTAETVARLIYDQVNIDTLLSAIDIDGDTITITSPVAGLTEGDAGFTVTRTREARSITAVLPFNASESDLETALGGTWDVSVPATGSWQFSALERGPQSLVNLDTSLLTVPSGVKGALSFDTLCGQEAFAAAGTGNVTTTFGIEITQDSVPRMCVSIPATVIRDNITTV